GCDGAERGAAHAGRVAARLGDRPAVVRLRLHARAGRRAAARGSAGGPVRAQAGHAHQPGHVRRRVAGLSLRAGRRPVHRGADGSIGAGRVLGLSAGFMVPLVLAVVAVMFTDQERPKAVGIWAAANFLALPIGPILGGWLLSSYWWGWVFLMNLPVVAIGMVAVAVLVPESRAAERPGLDPVGIVASCAGLAGVGDGVIAAREY